MHSAGARALRGDDNDMNREAVLLQWERKIEAAERRDTGGRFVRSEDSPEPVAEAVALHAAEVAEDTGTDASPRFERSRPIERPEPVAERRTITITGQPTPPRRRRPVLDAQLAQPDRIALWAFLLGLLLVAVAAGTAHA
jgi:hypothetical protein